jgi:hypothetical protein
MSYGHQPALPEIVLVSDKFMRLNREMRELCDEDKEDEWNEKAQLFNSEVSRIIEESEDIDIYSILDKSGPELPVGRIENPDDLLHIYSIGKAESSNGYSRFQYSRIQGRLACWHCANEWMNQYHLKHQGTYSWSERKAEKFGFISGMQSASNDSCNIKLNINDYAIHPDNNTIGGYVCNKSEDPKHPADFGLILTRENSSFHWDKILLLREMRPGYDMINRISQSCLTYRPNGTFEKEKSSPLFDKMNRIIQYKRIETMDSYSKDRLKLHSNFSKAFKIRKYVLLHAISKYYDGTSGSSKILFRIVKSKGDLTISFTDLDDGELGLFIYSKEQLIEDFSNDDKLFSTIPEKVQKEMDLQKLSSYLGWNGIGQLHKFKPEGFSSGVENTSVVKLDLDELDKQSPLVKSFKNKYPDEKLPVISTAIKSILVFHYDSHSLKRILHKGQKSIVKIGQKIFVRIQGFDSPTVILNIKRKGNEKHIIHSDELLLEKNGFFSFQIPEDNHRNRNLQFSIKVNDKNNNFQRLDFTLALEIRSQDNTIRDIILDDSIENNKEILRTNVRYQLREQYGIAENDIDTFYFDKNDNLSYTEIIKTIIGTQKQEFSLPTSTLNNRFPGLDALVFDSEMQTHLAGRLRSTGIYTAVDNNELDMYDNPSRKWSFWDEHLVKLESNLHILFSPRTLRAIGLNPNRNEVFVTNHGTFIVGDLPSAVKNIRVTERPMFLDHGFKNPYEHINFLNNLFTELPNRYFVNKYQELVTNYQLEKSFNPDSTKGLRYWFNSSNWLKYNSTIHLDQFPISKFSVKANMKDGEIFCFDILMLKRKSDEERILVLRRTQKNNQKEYLPIGRLIPNLKGELIHISLDWNEVIKRESLTNLHDFLSWTSSKYENMDLHRAHDWPFITVESLRAFLAISEQHDSSEFPVNLVDFVQQYTSCFPEPLRRYMLGGGFYVKGEGNSDNMKGAINEELLENNQWMRRTLLENILQWLWLK